MHVRRSYRVFPALIPAVLVLLAGSVAAADVAAPPLVVGRPGVLNLRTGDVNTADLPNLLNGGAFPATACVVMLDGPMTPARRAALAGAGVQTLGYLPLNSFIADVSGATPERVRGLGFVTWVGEYRREWKIEADVLAGAHGRAWRTPERTALADQGRLAVKVWLFEGRAAAPAMAQMLAIPGAAFISSETVAGGESIAITLPAAGAGALADIADVQFVEMLPEYTARSNSIVRAMVQSGTSMGTPFYNQGLRGEGQIIAIIDGGLAQNHCSFLDPVNPIGPLHRKIHAYNITPRYDLHGTHVIGTAIGDGGDTGNTRGVAYNARVVFNEWPAISEASHLARYTLHKSQGAFIHSNSWGDDSTTAYDGGCRGIDSFQFDNDDSLILFSVTDLLSAVRNPENAKNSIAVTLSGNPPNENTIPCAAGGNGPTADGRRKPEVAAPGCSITSSAGTSGCSVSSLSGTSMSTPAVGGLAVLIRQYFTSGFYPSGAANVSDAFEPSGPLVKAMIINSAVDMTGFPGYPSQREGWGRVVGDNVAFWAGEQRRLVVREARNNTAGGLTTGAQHEFSVFVSPCESPMRVTLAFHDAPALANATLTPVNDLNLTVISPTGAVYLGNVFANGFSATGGAPDTLNNVEQVHVASPATGRWTVRVNAAAVNSAASQGYAVVVTGPVDDNACGSADFNCDGDVGTDADIEAFFLALAGSGPGDADFDRDGDTGTDADIEAFFRVLGGGGC